MFNLFHKHVWEEKERFYAPPINRGSDVKISSVELTKAYPERIERLLMGVTTIKYVCQDKNCKDIKTVEILGKEMK